MNNSSILSYIDTFSNQNVQKSYINWEKSSTSQVLNGAVKIDSYSIEETDYDSEMCFSEENPLNAIKHPSLVVRENDPACVLTPRERNLHEISCIEGPAAFLDILSPPYDSDTGHPRCTLYKAIGSNDNDKVKLVPMEPPENFTSENIKYMGPSLQ